MILHIFSINTSQREERVIRAQRCSAPCHAVCTQCAAQRSQRVAELLRPSSTLKMFFYFITTVDKYTSIVFMVYRIYGILVS